MAGFRYKNGDRPLDGYTIQHGAGRGGFGEVYYALSDSGREVALKVINGYEQIELRGVSQCMNLKSPHLVTIFDVRHNIEGVPFVIMEYVSGPSLRQIIDEAPGGVGTQKAAFFLREMGKGLAYLHDCGIVHRDLKPGNIFYENGYVKIGDYGLSKAISTTQHSQTVTVGTVHYMAPEIGQGRYDKTIDIYALGAVLFEMLTGQVPYLGASPGEILMKHMTAQPDLSNIEEPFATVIRKSMARNPADRYQNVQEMIEAVFGAEHVRQSVSCFSPESLSMVAGRVAAHVGGGSSGPTPARGSVPPPLPRDSDMFERLDRVAGRTGDLLSQATDRLSDLSDRMIDAGARLIPGAAERLRPNMADAAVADPIPLQQRRVLGIVTAIVAGVGAGLFTDARVTGFGGMMGIMFGVTMTLGATGGIIVAHRRLSPALAAESPFLHRLAFGGIASLFTLIVSLTVFMTSYGKGQEMMASTWAAVMLPLFLLNIAEYANPGRRERFVAGPAIVAAIAGLICAAIFDGFPTLAIGTLAGSCLAVQAAMPWARGGGASRPNKGRGGHRASPVTDAVETPTQRHVSADAPTLPSGPRIETYAMQPRVSNALRWGWLLAVPLLLSTGIMLLAGVGTGAFRAHEEQALAVGFGLGGLLLAAFCFARFFTLHYSGWWPYFVRPFAIFVCVQSALVSSTWMGFVTTRGDDMLIALFFLLFPIAMLPVLFFIRTRPPVAGAAASPLPSVPASAAGDAPAVSNAARWGWLLATPPFLATGIILLAGVGTDVFRSDDEQALALAFGFGALLLAIFTFVRFLTTRYTGWWPYFVRPIAVYLCVQSVLIAGFCMGFMNLRDEEALVALFFLLLPIAMLPILLIIRTKPVASAVAETPSASVPQPVSQASVTSSMHSMYRVVEPWDIFGWLLAVPAWLLLVAGVAMALVAAVDLPGFIGAGLADPRMAQDLSREFGFERWPVLLRTWMSILAHASLLLAAMLLIVARRGRGAAHMLRVVVAIAIFSMASAMLDGSLRGEWLAISDITGRANVPASIEQYLSNSSRMGAVISLLTLAVGLVVLVWPARKPAAVAVPAQIEEVRS